MKVKFFNKFSPIEEDILRNKFIRKFGFEIFGLMCSENTDVNEIKGNVIPFFTFLCK